MNDLINDWTRSLASAFLGRNKRVHYPHKRTHLQTAKLMQAHKLGRFTLGHYQSFTFDPPDHVTTSVFDVWSRAESDCERQTWTVTPITPEQLADWEKGRDWERESEHLVALSDPAGNILMSEVCSAFDAERMLNTAAEASTSRPANQDQNSLFPNPAVFVPNYPLTREEVRALAVYWSELAIQNADWCNDVPCGGTTELLVDEYTSNRLKLVTCVLGPDALRSVEQEARGRVEAKNWLAARDRPDDCDE